MNFKVSVLPHDVLINNANKINELLTKMQNHLITPYNERGSFDAINLIHEIADMQRELARDYKYTNEKPDQLSSIIWTCCPETRKRS